MTNEKLEEKKFRAWSIEKQSFVYFGITNIPEWVHEAEVEQYIGLKNKNGKDIYEGDLVKYSEGTEHWDGKYTEPLKVEMKNGSFFPFCGCGGEYSMDESEAEITGNAYSEISKDIKN